MLGNPVVIGAALDGAPSATQQYPLGTVVFGSDGRKYVYVQSNGANTNGTQFDITAATGVTAVNATGAFENGTGSDAANGDYFWARRHLAGAVLTE